MIYFTGYLGQKALKDAGLSYDEVEQACVGYCFGLSFNYIKNIC